MASKCYSRRRPLPNRLKGSTASKAMTTMCRGIQVVRDRVVNFDEPKPTSIHILVLLHVVLLDVKTGLPNAIPSVARYMAFCTTAANPCTSRLLA
jgi:hypothetical protein